MEQLAPYIKVQPADVWVGQPPMKSKVPAEVKEQLVYHPFPCDPSAAPVKSRSDLQTICELGHGSFSTVYAVTRKGTDTVYALKSLSKMVLYKERKVESVMREKEVMLKLRGQNPFILDVHGTFQDSDSLLFLLSVCAGGELHDWIARYGSLDITCATFYVAEILAGLAFIHDNGVIHCDIKPENIFLTEKLHVKIGDFGSAQTLPPGEKWLGNPSFGGTAEYMAPEMMHSDPISSATDAWSVGCMLYMCLSGALPFVGENDYLTMEKVERCAYVMPPAFCKEAADFIRRLLVLDPHARLGNPEMDGGIRALMSHALFRKYLNNNSPSAASNSTTTAAVAAGGEAVGVDGNGSGVGNGSAGGGNSDDSGSVSVDFNHLYQQQPPLMLPMLPSIDDDHQPLYALDTDLNSHDMRELFDCMMPPHLDEMLSALPPRTDERMAYQRAHSPWQYFIADTEYILKTERVVQRKGLRQSASQLVLTDEPQLLVMDPEKMRNEMTLTLEDFKTMRPVFQSRLPNLLIIHLPRRTWYFETGDRQAVLWAALAKMTFEAAL
eukprot:m.137465 g.137465  ORF g.137465 m.137465 type:complete len:552 (-) comp16603_c0_seq4:372-2027(-)